MSLNYNRREDSGDRLQDLVIELLFFGGVPFRARRVDVLRTNDPYHPTSRPKPITRGPVRVHDNNNLMLLHLVTITSSHEPGSHLNGSIGNNSSIISILIRAKFRYWLEYNRASNAVQLYLNSSA